MCNNEELNKMLYGHYFPGSRSAKGIAWRDLPIDPLEEAWHDVVCPLDHWYTTSFIPGIEAGRKVETSIWWKV